MKQRAYWSIWPSLILLLLTYPTLIVAREAGERAGTEDINIGVGELQSHESDNEAGSVVFGDGIRGTRPGQESADTESRRIPAHNPEWTDSNDSDPGIANAQSHSGGAEEGPGGAEHRNPQTLRHRDR